MARLSASTNTDQVSTINKEIHRLQSLFDDMLSEGRGNRCWDGGLRSGDVVAINDQDAKKRSYADAVRMMPGRKPTAISTLLQQCAAWADEKLHAPASLFNDKTKPILIEMADRGKKNSDAWITRDINSRTEIAGTGEKYRNIFDEDVELAAALEELERKKKEVRDLEETIANLRSLSSMQPLPEQAQQTPERVYYPAIAYKMGTTLVGFEFLKFKPNTRHFKEWGYTSGHVELPAHYDNEGTYHTLYSFTMNAMLVNSISSHFDLPINNAHFICKGFQEYNINGILPIRSSKKALLWYIDTDDVKNHGEFVKSVIESDAFIRATSEDTRKHPMRRIVVWIMLKGHMMAFCWDQIYEKDGALKRDVLFIMSTIMQDEFAPDPEINETIINEFERQLTAKQLIKATPHKITNLQCTSHLQRSMTSNTKDIACVVFTGFMTFILSTVVHIEAWDGNDIQKPFWDFCRTAYANYEHGFIHTLQEYIQGGHAIWICPAMQHKHVNIKDVYLMAVSAAGDIRKLTYDWDRGWEAGPVGGP